MSQEAAKQFMEKMKDDEAFRNKIMSVEDPKERLKLINQDGFDVTPEDLKAVTEEISDDDLDSVAGGCGLQVGCQGDLFDSFRRGVREIVNMFE